MYDAVGVYACRKVTACNAQLTYCSWRVFLALVCGSDRDGTRTASTAELSGSTEMRAAVHTDTVHV